jgi:hypothetical protein
MPRADQPIRQWTTLKMLESNGRVTLRQIADALSTPFIATEADALQRGNQSVRLLCQICLFSLFHLCYPEYPK